MPLHYLLDEHLTPEYRTGLIRREPGLRIWRIGEPGAPPIGTPDPEILCWCEENGFVVVTANRRTMPVHLAAHISAGRHAPGIIVLRRGAAMGAVIDALLLVAGAGLAADLRDQILYVPLE